MMALGRPYPLSFLTWLHMDVASRLERRIAPQCRLRVLRHDDGPRGLMIAKQTGGWAGLMDPCHGAVGLKAQLHGSTRLEQVKSHPKDRRWSAKRACEV